MSGGLQAKLETRSWEDHGHHVGGSPIRVAETGRNRVDAEAACAGR
jgi:hypothetical protein